MAKKKNNLLIVELIGGILAVVFGLLTLKFLRDKPKTKKRGAKKKKRSKK